MKINPKTSSRKQQKQPNNFIKYTGLGFQFLAAILLGFWLGKWLDEKYASEKPWFTMAFMVLFLLATLFTTIRDLSNE